MKALNKKSTDLGDERAINLFELLVGVNVERAQNVALAIPGKNKNSKVSVLVHLSNHCFERAQNVALALPGKNKFSPDAIRNALG